MLACSACLRGLGLSAQVGICVKAAAPANNYIFLRTTYFFGLEKVWMSTKAMWQLTTSTASEQASPLSGGRGFVITHARVSSLTHHRATELPGVQAASGYRQQQVPWGVRRARRRGIPRAGGQPRGCSSLLLAPGTHKHLAPGEVWDKGHWDLVKHITQPWHRRGILFCKRIYS